MNDPKANEPSVISILMAAYNAEKTIEQAIASVTAQSFRAFELIVIDDCSVDRTREIVTNLQKSDSRIRLVQQEKNRGVSAARKRGLEEAQGEWIAILDSDDLWEPQKLEKQLFKRQSMKKRMQ